MSNIKKIKTASAKNAAAEKIRKNLAAAGKQPIAGCPELNFLEKIK